MKQTRKTILSFLLMMIMVLAMAVGLSQPAYAQDETHESFDVTFVGAENFENGKDALISFKAKNNLNTKTKGIFIVGLYEKFTTKMVSYNYVVDEVEGTSAKAWGSCLPIPATGDYVIKSFIWSDINNGNLLSNIVTANLGEQPGPVDKDKDIKKALDATGKYVLSQVDDPEVGIIGGEWAVLGLSRAGVTVPENYYENYLEKVVAKTAKEAAKSSKVWDDKVTDVERVALAVSATGYDPQNISNVNLLDYIWNKSANFPGITPNGELGARQGSNELIYGLLAVQANDALIEPQSSQNTKTEMVNQLLGYYKNGWFALEKDGSANVDITAMALQALAKNQSLPNVTSTINSALTSLSKAQNASGHFVIGSGNEQTTSVETVVQVIVALTELGVDPQTDTRFIKGDKNLVDALFDFYLGNGQFTHELGGHTVDQMATEQSLYALSALNRFYDNGSSLYNMNDLELKPIKTEPQPAKGIEITESYLETAKARNTVLKANNATGQLETYYYLASENYVYQGEAVKFVNENQIEVGGKTYELRNKKIDVPVISVTGDSVEINFTGTDVPVGQISGLWSSLSGNESARKIVYNSDIPGSAKIESADYQATPSVLTIDNLEPGTYHLTGGQIYEKANKQSSGVDFGSGKVIEGSFGCLPDITFTIEPAKAPVGKVKLSVEKRTIGKGDTLDQKEVDLYENDNAFTLFQRTLNDATIDFDYYYSEQYDSSYISAVAGDSEFDHGASSGWMYQVNGVFPDVGMSQKTLSNNDIIRVRYTIDGGNDLKQPLLSLLKNIVAEAQREVVINNYTPESVANLNAKIEEAKVVTEDAVYYSTDTDKELAVSGYIAKVNAAVKALVKNTEQGAEASVPDDFENDLWLQYDFKELKVGDTTNIYPRRVPQAISNAIANDVERPNFNFEIIQGDSIEIDLVKNGTKNDKANIKAVKPGATIVKVTYDEFYHSKIANKPFGKVSDVNVAYVAYYVTDGTDSGITIDFNDEFSSYDTVYFTEGNTVDYTVAPIINGATDVEVSCNGKAVASNNGKYALPLENRTNIICVKASNGANEKYFYRMIDARKIEIKVVNMTSPGSPLEAGDTANISFHGITLPVYKLATIYNPCYSSDFGSKSPFVEYKNDTLGTFEGKSKQWDLATQNSFDVKFTEAGEYEFNNGQIFVAWWGSKLGTDKGMEGQGQPGIGSPQLESYFSIMPDFTISVAAGQQRPVDNIVIDQTDPTVEVNKTIKLTTTLEPANATNKKISWSSEDETIAIVANDGTVTGKKIGQIKITVITEDGNKVASVIVNVIAEKPNTEGQRQSLKNLINAVKALQETNYTTASWSNLQTELVKAEAVYNDQAAEITDLSQAESNLKAAKDQLVKAELDITVNISPATIHPGSTVTVNLVDLKIPEIESSEADEFKGMTTKYSSDIPGLSTINSEEILIADLAGIKTFQFTVPENTPEGTYTLSDGYLSARYKIHPQFGGATHYVNFYKGKMPDISIVVKAKDPNVPDGAKVITEEYLTGANKYETFYYLEDEEFYYKGAKVVFDSESQITADGKTYNLKNKQITLNTLIADDEATFTFTGLVTPIGQISGLWNSTWAGEIKVAYETDIPGQPKVMAESATGAVNGGNFKSLQLSNLAPGTYHLINGQIFEKANSYSPGADLGNGVVKEAYFGRLPDIEFTIE